ncbi:MAG: cysteine--tRNA ligase [Candidatus Omnitrophica bacterium]|nr:cysteine--tRNA ligase [Candidatus Omnitrophota bacterium]
MKELPKIHIYNTLTKKKEEFKPLKAKRIGIYSCGVTVYDDCHIGHARSLYTFEVIRNFLKYRGYDVKFIRNITDIDDKIINKAKELGEDWNAVASRYIACYEHDLKLLNLSKADIEPRATEHISGMKKFISLLIKKGYAYEAGGDVYFSVRKFKDYGKLSGQSIDQMKTGARIEPGEHKQDPLDFALWKKSRKDEPSWPSPWGEGRPGWHIECSLMSSKYLGQPFDIHAGGRDLIFPHHENEIAQSESFAGKPFARYWMHHGLLTINGQKMSKSLGNYVTVKDFMGKYGNANLLKLLFLNAHYSQPIDYNEEKMQEVRRSYERINILKDKLEKDYGTVNINKSIKSGTGFIKPFKDKFIEYMDDDFNTPRALSVLFELVNNCNKLLDSNDEFKQFKLRYAMDVIKELAGIFGLSPDVEKTSKLEVELTEKIKLRDKLKKEKKYLEADKIRKELKEQGIILEDSKEGTQWRRKI